MSEIEQIRERFRSGNNVPVPDIRLSRKEWEAIESAIAQARREEREQCAQECEAAGAFDVADRIRALPDTDERTEK